jgi:hypothetical protein
VGCIRLRLIRLGMFIHGQLFYRKYELVYFRLVNFMDKYGNFKLYVVLCFEGVSNFIYCLLMLVFVNKHFKE